MKFNNLYYSALQDIFDAITSSGAVIVYITLLVGLVIAVICLLMIL